MEHLLEGMALIATPVAILAILVGTFVGIIIGALPGLGSVVALTIVLPFTYSLGQAPSIALLLGVYAGSIYGGSLSAILINTPGTPASAATALDGFAMAREGRAGEALGWATIASVVGGLFSTLVLVLLAPQLARVALRFGPVEVFALIVLALTSIAAISRGSLIMGLLGGMIGLFLATVGSDPITGDIRFNFGWFPLTSGFNIIAVAIGLFALSEVFVRALEPSGRRFDVLSAGGMKLPSWRELKPRLRQFLKGSVIGTGIGVLPGTGAAAASFISYAEAKRTSSNRQRFGDGEPDGIIASETANNAVTGGALVPTLALGIPGDVVTAVMLTTLLIQGITPGVRLMVDNPEIVYAAFIAFFLINLILLPQGMLAARLFARILKVPEPLLVPAVVILSLIGAYGVRGNWFDLVVALGAGLFGLLLRLFGVPLAPLIIGMVLGSELELSLRQGLILKDDNFWLFFTDHPIALALFGATALVLLSPILGASRKLITDAKLS